MRKIFLILSALLFVFAGSAFAAKHKNKDTESPRLVKPASTLAGSTLDHKEEPTPAPSTPAPKNIKPAATLDASAETGYSINTKTGVRHNKKCRFYGKGKNSRPCSATEGKPCKICGG